MDKKIPPHKEVIFQESTGFLQVIALKNNAPDFYKH